MIMNLKDNWPPLIFNLFNTSHQKFKYLNCHYCIFVIYFDLYNLWLQCYGILDSKFGHAKLTFKAAYKS